MSRRPLIATSLGILAIASCGRQQPAAVVHQAPPNVVFQDVTKVAGIDFLHQNGAAGKMYLPETMGAGCAFLDYDADGYLDILLVNGSRWSAPAAHETMRLYRNRGDGTFMDVTEQAGLNIPHYGMGVSAGDYDNDGFDDLFVTGVGRSILLRNDRGNQPNSRRRFRDVTGEAGLSDKGWSTSATWIDYDRDGLLDLFVCRYVQWSPNTNRVSSVDGINPSYSTPEQYQGESCRLYRNTGGGGFRDVTKEAGIYNPRSKALGVVSLDFDQDGWQDLAVANDTEPNFLFHNQTDGTFKEVALELGVAVSDEGRAKAGMGIDAGDEMNNGSESLAITNFSGEQLTLYRRTASSSFIDVAAQSGIGAASQLYLGFGVFFFDYDLDGRADIFVSNGHIQGDVGLRGTGVLYREPALLLRNRGSGQFLDATASTGNALLAPTIGRGAAWGDYDNDGDADILITSNRGSAAGDATPLDGRARLLRNDNRTGNGWVRLVLRGARDNRSAFGSRVRIRAGGLEQTRTVRAGSSFLSQSDPRPLFGIGKHTRVDSIEIQWPSGQLQSLGPIEAGQTVLIVQPESTP